MSEGEEDLLIAENSIREHKLKVLAEYNKACVLMIDNLIMTPKNKL